MKIQTKTDLEQCFHFISEMRYYNPRDTDWKNKIKSLPANLQKILENNKAIYPEHLDIKLFKQLFIENLTDLNPNFKADENASKTIDQICRIATNDEKFMAENNFSIKKGILLMGKVGSGKTLMFRGLVNLLRLFPIYKPEFLPAYAITENFCKSGFDIFTNGIPKNSGSLMYWLLCDKLFIDDLGTENIVSNFGNTTNVIGELILRRYDRNVKTFGTTNLDLEHLKTFYGDRVYSRITEMMNFCVMEGDDRRK
ncbi:MAG: hypothetical protein K0M40_22520 [Prolixibacteraceae bacterium]|nr:hypothetical protein [Prolixibacteraceae bacterium]